MFRWTTRGLPFFLRFAPAASLTIDRAALAVSRRAGWDGNGIVTDCGWIADGFLRMCDLRIYFYSVCLNSLHVCCIRV